MRKTKLKAAEENREDEESRNAEEKREASCELRGGEKK